MQISKIQSITTQYIESLSSTKSLSNNTLSAYKQDLKCFSNYICVEIPHLVSVTTKTIEMYLTYLRTIKNLHPATIRRRMLTVQAFFSSPAAKTIQPSNPFDSLILDLRVPKRLPRPIDRHTTQKLLSSSSVITKHDKSSQEEDIPAALPRSYHSTVLAMKLMLATGIRIGELTSIRISDISIDNGRIHITGKGEKDRIVYVTNAKLLLDLTFTIDSTRRLGQHDFLFSNTHGNKLTPQTLRKRIKKLSNALGIVTSITPHRFRHTAATMLLEEGVDIRLVQKLLGHSSISTTELYTYVSDHSLKDAIAKADHLRLVDADNSIS